MPRIGRLTAVLAALLLVGTALAPTTALAQGSDDEDEEAEQDRQEGEAGEEEPEDEQEDEERSVEISREGNSLTFELERETDPREDKVEMTWNAEEATFELEHESENETREIENKLEAVFGTLAEYRDQDGDGRYDPGEEIVSAWALGDEREDEVAVDGEAEWRSPTIENVTRDGKQGKLAESSASLGDQGTLTLRFLAFGDFVEMNGTELSPTGVKIDIVIEDYAYQANGTDLALFLETETENEFERDVEGDEETGVAASGQTGSELVFTWKDQAQVDGETRPVETTVLEEENETEQEDGESSAERERAFVLSYPRGEEIVHDPKAEVAIQSASDAPVPAPGVGAIVALVAGLATVVGRRR